MIGIANSFSTDPSRALKSYATSSYAPPPGGSSERSNDEVARQLTALRKAAQGTENLMPHIYAAVKAYATLGEICDSLRDVFGTHEEASIT